MLKRLSGLMIAGVLLTGFGAVMLGSDALRSLQQTNPDAIPPTKTLPIENGDEDDTCDEGTCCPEGVAVIHGTDESEHLSGGPGDQCIVARAGDDVADGKPDDDTLLLGAGNDLGLGRSGRDRIFGQSGNDVLDGSAHEDELHGGLDDDVLNGGSHEDVLFGNQGNDRLFGDAHDDLLVPGPGRDEAFGKTGRDRFLIRAACEVEEGDLVDGGPHSDTVESPLTQAELEALGAVFTSIESFEVVPPDPTLPAGACYRDQDQRIVCECCDLDGYDPAAKCGACLEGFHFDPDTEAPAFEGDLPPAIEPPPPDCVPDVTCGGFDCGPHGTCDDSHGYPRCDCDAPFIGNACNNCPAGLEPDGDDCTSTEQCEREFCNGHGACVLGVAGRLACDCDEGFGGANCGPPDLQIGALPDSIEEDEELAMYPSVANGFVCPGGFTWSIQSGPGSLAQNANGFQATYTPDPLPADTFITAAVVRVACDDDPSVYEERAVCVVGDDSLPVKGTCKQNLIPIDEAMLAYLNAAGLKGATLALTKDENLVYLRGYGFSNQGMTECMPTCAPMRIASVTKAITRAGIQMLIDDNEVIDGEPFTLDTLVMDHFRSALRISAGERQPGCGMDCATVDFTHGAGRYAGFAPNFALCTNRPFATGSPDDRWFDMQVRDVMFHNSGMLSNNPLAGPNDPYAHPNITDPIGALLGVANDLELDGGVGPPTAVDLLEWQAGACLLDAPGQQPQSTGGTLYSNIGYVLLGRITELVSPEVDDYWFDYLTDTVFLRAGDANPGWVLGDGMEVGRNPVLHEDLLFVGQVLDPTDEEPDYCSVYPGGKAVAAMFQDDDGVWQRGGPVVGGAYADFALFPMDSGGGLVSSAESLSKFFRAYNMRPGTPRRAFDLPVSINGNPSNTVSGNGYLPGTTAFHAQWDSRAHVVRTPQAGTAYGMLPSQTVTPPPAVQVSLIFNQEVPRRNDPNFPAFDDGTQNFTLLFDALTLAISESPLGNDPWPPALTEEEQSWGCDPYAPPPPPESCGDGAINDPDEECDGADLDGQECTDFAPYTGGVLDCTGGCKFDFTDCENPNCGNGILDPGEQCDAGEDVPDFMISSGSPRSIDRCNPDSCLWEPCAEFEDGLEGCACEELGPASEGDICRGANSDDGADLICRFGPSHQGKKCMRCPYNGGDYGDGVGCPCGPGDSCDRWEPADGGPDVLACTQNVLVCRASAKNVLSDQDQVGDTPRCWDVLAADPYDNPGGGCEPDSCLPGSVCLYGDCEFPDCEDTDGVPGICAAMNMTCDPDPYGNGDPYCINTNGCPVPGTLNGTSTCGPATTDDVVNVPFGVQDDLWCPGPYRF